MRGDFVRAEAEYETALRMAPNAAEILIFYIGWASTFGKPERGAELVERAIRLDPNYPTGRTGPFALAYFMAGRYERGGNVCSSGWGPRAQPLELVGARRGARRRRAAEGGSGAGHPGARGAPRRASS